MTVKSTMFNDCFAYMESPVNGKARCSVKINPVCDGCKFYKAKEKFEADRKSAEEALSRKGLVPTLKIIRGYNKSGKVYEKSVMSVERVTE